MPVRYGDATTRALMAAGAQWDIVPYGTKSPTVMRIEKSHVAGNELNGTTTAGNLGLSRMMPTKKDFIGRMLVMRDGLADANRPVLVGVKPLDRSARLHASAHFFNKNAAVEGGSI